MQHSPAFLALVNDAKSRIQEIPAAELPAALSRTALARLIDVREAEEYANGHLAGAAWMGKGVLERDIEAAVPERDTPLFLYCGGGYRSALAADNLQKMGYTHVFSVDGGWRVLQTLMPTTKP